MKLPLSTVLANLSRHKQAPAMARGDAEVEQVELLASDSPLVAKLPAPDDCRAFLSFNICNTVGAKGRGIGPVQNQNIVGFQPKTLDQSAQSMLFQCFNYNHLMRFYSGEPGTEEYIPNDRIIGCIVAVAHPAAPASGFQPTDETALNCTAVVFKMANGVPKLLGEHLTAKKKQSVSMEVTTSVGNLGVWRPSTREIKPLLDPPQHWKSAYAVNDKGLPTVGKLSGEQLIIIYGLESPVQFRGVGMTPTPAERLAKITGVQCRMSTAEDSEVMDIAGKSYYGVTAKAMARTWQGQLFRYKNTGRLTQCVATYTEGRPTLPTWKCGIVASEEDPVLLLQVISEQGVPTAEFLLQRASLLPKVVRTP